MTDFLTYILNICDFLYAHFLPMTEQDYFMAYALLIFCCIMVAIVFVCLLLMIPYLFKQLNSMFRRFM